MKSETGDLISQCAILATLLEVSAYPKPGNVHRTQDSPGTRYEQFLSGGVAIGPSMRRLAERGFEAEEGLIDWCDIEVGSLVLEAVTETLRWQKGGNVNLGSVLLLAPLSAAGGAALYEGLKPDARKLREKLNRVLENTVPEDAVAIVEAIRMAMTKRVLGVVDNLDVRDESTFSLIRSERIKPKEIFLRCADRDSICTEWVTDFKTTFDVGHPYLRRSLEGSNDINTAVVDTFLFILSGRPDSLIARKSGLKRAEEVSERARRILGQGGSRSSEGGEMLRQLDRELQSAGGALNPGTTADLTAASLFVALFEGWRP